MKKYMIALAVSLLPSLTTMAQQAENLGKEQSAEKWIKNIDASITTGTTGIGIDVAVPLSNVVTLRTGYSWMPRTHVTMNFGVQVGDERMSDEEEAAKFNKLADMLEEYTGTRVDNNIDMVGTPTMNNFKLLVDVHPFRNKNWHITTGFYWGPSKIAKAENAIYDGTSLVAVSMYNNLYERVKASYENFIPYMQMGDQYLYAGKELYDKFMSYGRMGVHLGERKDGSIFRLEPDANNNVSATIHVNNFKPYLGFGYGGRLLKNNDIYHISFDAGILFWGGTPRIITNDIYKVTFSPNEDYTEAIKNEQIEPGVNLAKDISNIPGKVGDYVKFFKAFKVYPVLELRLSRRISF
ncbi:hypothetical protein [Segatella copri]|uniref:hypothetical protein n=1 Tax=Segatella copri TaxID=165179 RepID=UPI001934A9F1|nr:hypothetical protein [Segatella copri]MBM0129084.1 hypothetical protein [Segatella copri]